MKTNRVFTFLFVFIVLPYSGLSQMSKLKKADKAFEVGEYFNAIDIYKDAYTGLRDKDIKTEITFKVAECYRILGDPGKAEIWYKKAVVREYPDPLAILYYADALKMNQKYEDAINEYNRYRQLVPGDPKGEGGVLSCQLAMKWIENPSNYVVEEMKVFNSKEKDFAPAYASEDYSSVYLTSSRDGAGGGQLHGATGENFADIFVSQLDKKGKWSIPLPLEKPLNTEFEEGTPSFSPDYNTMYFTRCQMGKGKKYGCSIYQSTRSSGSWSKPELIPILEDTLVAAHPAISPDELTLYFVSDMPGGMGGKDIWKVVRSSVGTDWGAPVNLGEKINTDRDELFPYVHADGTLYFSSNGLTGMGGLDIFKATEKDGQWTVENMMYPVNSFADDFGIVFENETERGFFTSTRSSRGDDNIYSFYLPPLRFNMTGVVKDDKTGKILDEAKVKLIGSDGITIETDTKENGQFRFMLKPNTDYVFIASDKGYLNGKIRETTKGLTESKDFEGEITLSAIDKPIEVPNIFYDFARWELRPESMVTLDKLVETLNDNPNVTIELRSHTDSRGSDADNVELSQKRAQSVVDYLIEKGIAADRLQAKGLGETLPKVVNVNLVEEYSFLKEGTKLTEGYINSLKTIEQQEIAHQINRRTEFQVLRTDYNTGN